MRRWRMEGTRTIVSRKVLKRQELQVEPEGVPRGVGLGSLRRDGDLVAQEDERLLDGESLRTLRSGRADVWPMAQVS